MKNLVVVLALLAMTGIAVAATGDGLSENPYTFSTDGSMQGLDGWETWGGGVRSSIVSGGVCTITSTTGYEIIFNHDNVPADLPGAPVPGTDTLALSFDVVGSNPTATNCVVKIEYFNINPNLHNGTGATRIDTETPDLSSFTGQYVMTAPDVMPADTLGVTCTIGVEGSGAEATVVIDNVFLGKVGTGGTYLGPTDEAPVDNTIFNIANKPTTLSWTNPDPLVAGPIGVQARIQAGDVNELDISAVWQPLAGDAESADIATLLGTALVDDQVYSWQVQLNDPNTGGVNVITDGPIWQFEIGDEIPVCSAGDDQFNWVAKPDGVDSDQTTYTITLVGTYTDDGYGSSTIAAADANYLNLGWAIENGENGVVKISDTHVPNAPGTGGFPNSGTVTAVYKTVVDNGVDPYTVIPGYWDMQLQVTDAGGNTGIDVAYVRVDEDCAAAAAADGDDTFDTTFDFNGDCINDIADFAEFAAAWLLKSDKYVP